MRSMTELHEAARMITGSEAVITVTFSSYLVSTTTGKGQMDIFRLRYKDAPKENGGSELKQKHVREESLFVCFVGNCFH